MTQRCLMHFSENLIQDSAVHSFGWPTESTNLVMVISMLISTASAFFLNMSCRKYNANSRDGLNKRSKG